MGKVTIKLNGIDTSVDLIRYFELNGKQFLIYTLGELDNQAYQISYITKIEDHKGQLLSGEEWTLMTAIIKKIAGEGATISELVDLPASSLQGLDVYYTKPFKLPMASTNLLCAKEVKEITVEKKEVTEQVPSSDTVKKQELENDADPVLTEKYTFHVQDEPVVPDEKVEIPALEPSKMISFEEFKEDMNDFEDKLDIDQFEEMKLEELPETEPLMAEEDHKEDEKDMNQKKTIKETLDALFDTTAMDSEESPVSNNGKDKTIANLEHMKTEVTKRPMQDRIVSEKLASPTFVPIVPFKEEQMKSSKGLFNGLYESLFDRKKEDTPQEEELKPISIEEFDVPDLPDEIENQESDTTTGETGKIDYEKLEAEIAELRKQIQALANKIDQ